MKAPEILVSVLVLGSAWSLRRARGRAGPEPRLALLSPGAQQRRLPPVGTDRPGVGPIAGWRSWGDVGPPQPVAGATLGAILGALGLALVGLPGAALGVGAGLVLPRVRSRSRARRSSEQLERQLAELSESAALAVRGGLSLAQAFDFASEGTAEPLGGLLARFQDERRLGASFEDALDGLGEAIDTEDGRLLVLIVESHARSGATLAGALQEVAGTIRHRIALRRELRALSAQGRVSGAILGTLPLGFFLVLAMVSHDRLAPVYRSTAGIAMISAGLVMEGLAFIWIRRLLRVEA